MKIKGRVGISPVIATVLLVAIVLVLAVIIFIWARSTITEDIQKFNEPISRACDNVNINVHVSGNSVEISNNGDQVPLYGIKLKVNDGGKISVVPSSEGDIIPAEISPGQSKSIDVSSYTSADINAVIPVLKGTDSQGNEKIYVCDKAAKSVA